MSKKAIFLICGAFLLLAILPSMIESKKELDINNKEIETNISPEYVKELNTKSVASKSIRNLKEKKDYKKAFIAFLVLFIIFFIVLIVLIVLFLKSGNMEE